MKKRIILVVCFCITQFGLVAQHLNVQKIPRDTSYTVYQSLNKIHSTYPEAKPAMAILPKEVVAETDLVYALLTNADSSERRLHLDIYSPAKAGIYPAVVMIHGGGWQSGDKSMQMPMAMQIAAQGYITVTLEYQLSPEAQYPQAVYNIKSALRWLHANAIKYGIDTSSIAISGSSAGGQLAALVGMTNGVKQFEGTIGITNYSSAVQAVINMDGVVDFLAPASLNKVRKSHSADVSWLGGTFEEKPAIWKEASPIFWVNKSAPPILFMNSGFSRFHAGQDEMIGILNELGIYYEVHKFDVKVHPFWLFHPWFEPTVEIMVRFLDKEFKN